MMTRYLPPRFVSLSLIALTTACGCQAGAGDYVSNLLAKPSQWASNIASPSKSLASRRQMGQLAKERMPTPVVTERNYASVQLAMGESFEKEGNLASAESAYHAAVRNDPSMARAHHRLALVKEKAGKGSESQAHLLKASQLQPDNAEIACDMGYWCYLRRDWRQAERYFKQALELDPTLERAANNLGLVYARTNRPEEAVRLFAAAGLNLAEARTNLGFVLMTEQRLPEAHAQFEQALAADPGAEKAKHALAALRSVEHESFRYESVAQRDLPNVAQGAVQIASNVSPETTSAEFGAYTDLPIVETALPPRPMEAVQRLAPRRSPYDEPTPAWQPVVIDAERETQAGGAVSRPTNGGSGPSGPAWRPIQLLSAVLPQANRDKPMNRRNNPVVPPALVSDTDDSAEPTRPDDILLGIVSPDNRPTTWAAQAVPDMGRGGGPASAAWSKRADDFYQRNADVDAAPIRFMQP